jgi:hypothetical protein
MDDLGRESDHALECGHAFHARCLIGWFQRGNLSCPTCRADAHRADVFPPMSLLERARFIRRTVGRRAPAPGERRQIISSVRAAEQQQRDRQRDLVEFQRRHAPLLREWRDLRAKKYKAWRRVRRLQRLLGIYQHPSLTLPAVAVTRYD